MTLWRTIDSAPSDEVVLTKIDDEHGKRNVHALKRHGRLWWTPDGAMYVYYTPTHWARVAHGERATEKIICNCEHGHDRPYWTCPKHGYVVVGAGRWKSSRRCDLAGKQRRVWFYAEA